MGLAGKLHHKLFVGSGVRGVYSSFAEARAAVPKNSKVGYDNKESGNLYPYLLDYTKISDFAALFHFTQLVKPGSRIFDFGGNTGPLFYTYSSRWPLPPGVTWTVCDVPAVVEAGRALAKTRPSEGLAFTSRFEDAAGADLLLTSGTLQYVEENLPTLLGRLRDAQPRHVLANRTALWDKPSFATLQNLGPVICPYQVRNRAAFLFEMDAAGYRIADTWECPESGISVRWRPAYRVRPYVGLLFERKDAQRKDT
jgi:putative methyltransferase (TIGR04325 family)